MIKIISIQGSAIARHFLNVCDNFLIIMYTIHHVFPNNAGGVFQKYSFLIAMISLNQSTPYKVH